METVPGAKEIIELYARYSNLLGEPLNERLRIKRVNLLLRQKLKDKTVIGYIISAFSQQLENHDGIKTALKEFFNEGPAVPSSAVQPDASSKTLDELKEEYKKITGEDLNVDI